MLVDDHEVYRIGLRAVIESQEGLCVVAEAGTGEEVIAVLEQTEVDLLVLDIGLPGISGIEVAARVHEQMPQVAILMLSLYSDDQRVQTALREGAMGYVVKDEGAEGVVRAIREVAAGRKYLCSDLSQRAIEAYVDGKPRTRSAPPDGLTPREAEVLTFVAQGCTNGQIAEMLVLSPRTIETHRANAMEKLGLKNKAQIVHYALRSGLLTLDDVPDS